MKLVMLGTGYVGLVSGSCFAEMGNTVTCVDTDEEKIRMLNDNRTPIYETGLDTMIEHNTRKKRLFFSTEASEAIRNADVVFICVGTPPNEDGSADLGYVWESARTIGRSIGKFTLVVTKSTVPVGTTRKVGEIIAGELAERGLDVPFDMVNNPEFLKEGNAIADFMRPDRVVVGTNSEYARTVMRRLYMPFFRTGERITFMSILSSELTKYASNSMLATRISFMNEIARLAEKIGADIEEIRRGMAQDKRIGKYFLYAGAGYGGSCFPKDVSALIRTGQVAGCEMNVISAVNEVNKTQKRIVAEKVLRFFGGDLSGRKIAVWGLAFKPETDDVREAPSLEVISIIRRAGAVCSVHDPAAMDNARAVLGDDSILYSPDSYRALEDTDALVVMTEWMEYRTPDWKTVRSLMKNPLVFDGRNLYDPDELGELGFQYFGIGYGTPI